MIFAVFACTVLLLYLFWLLIPILHGLPWRPTRLERARKALRLAGVKPGEVVYDLGAGDGRVLLIAASEFGAQAIGVEIGPMQCLVAWLQATFRGLNGRVRIRLGNFYQANYSDADVVFVYMTSRDVAHLRPHLEKQLRHGTRVVSISADFHGWQPAACDTDELIFLYEMPPEPGGLETYLANKHLQQ